MYAASDRTLSKHTAARLAYMVGAPLLRLGNRLVRLCGARSVGAQAVVHRLESGRRQILLVRQTYMDGWSFPGGGVKSRETPIDAVHRELREEAGILPIGTPELVGVYLNQYLGLDDYVVLYRVEAFHRQPFRSWEIAETAWFDLDALPADIRPACARRIGEMFRGAAISSRW
ncbi:MAG TPA: NUDIX domain-containing protein [Stellaceae bacterium]|nr:NUDIX domain-containing protein [Stellaceae bacterium]